MRNFIYILSLALLCAVVFYWFYRDFDKPGLETYDTMITVPQSASVIFETEDAADMWRDFSQNNLMWSQLQATDYFFKLNELGNTLDSLIRNDSRLRTYLSEKPICVSLHPSGAKGFNYLFSLRVEPDIDYKELHESIKGLFRTEEVESRLYGGENILTLESPFLDKPLHYFVYKRSLVFSAADILLEESIRAAKQDASVLELESFNTVRETADTGVRAHVFIHYKQFKRILSQYASAAGKSSGFFRQPFAEWSALDLSASMNSLSLNGFVLAPDSTNSWLSTFSRQEAVTPELIGFLPANTAYFLFLGFGDFATYRENQLRQLEKTNNLYPVENLKREYNNRCDCDMEKLATSWIGDQAIAFLAEPVSDQYPQSYFAAFRAKDVDTAKESLTELARSTGVVSDEESDIFRLKIEGFYGSVVSDAFSGLESPFVGFHQDLVLMANSQNALRTYMAAIEAGRLFSTTPEYEEIEDQLFLDAHLMLYSGVARSPYIYQNVLGDEYAKVIDENSEMIRDFGSFLFQVAYSGNGLFYNGITLLQTEAYTPETGAVWELALADRVTQGPFIVKNHYTGALETLVQDENNLIHLISANGKVIWSKQLKGQIRSEVHQVDVYKNNKLQMLFNTDQKLHLLDRNGNSVESYPVKLPAEPSTSVSVADYDGSRDYRFFIPLSDGQILCYAITGKQVDGWDFKPVSEKIVLPVRHIRIKRKDYLFTVLAKGEILLLNRRGKPRYEAKQNADGLFSDNYLIEEGGQIGTTALYYADSSGTMYRLEFGGGLEKIRSQSSVLLDYAVDDFDGDGSVDFAFLYPEELGVYEFSGDVSFEITLPEEMKNATLSFYSGNNLKRIAITDQDREQIYLFDEEGNQSSAIPVFGSTVPAMGDINLNGYPDLITADGSGYVYAYAVK